MVDQVLCHELDRALHCEDGVALALLLLLHQSEDSVIQQGTESVVEELSHWHLLVVFLLLDQLQQVLEHVVVRATVDAGSHVFLTLVFFLDLSHEHFNFLFEKFVSFALVIFVCWLELDFDQVSVGLEEVYKMLLADRVPLEIFVLLEFKFFETFVNLKSLPHKLKTLRGNIA